MKLLVSVLFIAVTQATTVAPKLRVDLPNAVDRTNQMLQGLLDPMAKNIGFFFACGQIGGYGSPYKWNECSCYNRASCVGCYRWWDAVGLESTATYGIYTNTRIKSHFAAAQTVFAHSPYNSNWNATQFCTFIDDFVWYGIAYLRVYEWLKVRVNTGTLLICVIYLHNMFDWLSKQKLSRYYFVGTNMAEQICWSLWLGMEKWLGPRWFLWWILVEYMWWSKVQEFHNNNGDASFLLQTGPHVSKGDTLSTWCTEDLGLGV